MATPEIACPVCDADLSFGGDESVGDLIHCTFCGAPFLLRVRPQKDDGEAGWDLEEDF